MEPTKFTTKTGEEITIRIAEPSDAEHLLHMKLEYLKDSVTIPLFEDEYPDQIQYESQLIMRLANEKNSVLLVAEHEGQLIGNIDLNGNQRRKLFHTGVVGMGIRSKWRNRGVGRALLEAVIRWSIENTFLRLIWLEVYQSNPGGNRLYQNLGFKEVGKIENFFREKDEYIDKLTMVRHL